MDTTCSEYENGTALHIAAANLGVSAAQVLLNFGADLNLVDDLARKAHDCIPEMHAIGKWLHFWNFKLQFKPCYVLEFVVVVRREGIKLYTLVCPFVY